MLSLILVASLLASEPPFTIENSSQLSRTMVPAGYPAAGCMTAASTGITAVGFNSGTDALPTPVAFKTQLLVTNNSTAAVAFCWSQDPSPTISRVGNFSADGDSYYGAGPGNCFILAPGSWPMSSIKESFVRGNTAATRTPGARAMTCSNSSRPCAAAAECDGGGACTVYGTTHTYLFAVHRAGADNDSHACVAR